MWRTISYMLVIGFVLFLSSCQPEKTLTLETVLNWSQSSELETAAPSSITSVYIKLTRNRGFEGHTFSTDNAPYEIKDVDEGTYIVTVLGYEGDEVVWEGSGNITLQKPENDNEESTNDGWVVTHTIAMMEVVETDLPAAALIDGEPLALELNSTETRATARWFVNGMAGGNSEFGTVTDSGIYTPPSSLPVEPDIEIQSYPFGAEHHPVGIVIRLIEKPVATQLFAARSNPSDPLTLWTTDGTPEGTYELKSADANSDASHEPVLITNEQLFPKNRSEDTAYMTSSADVFGEKRYFTTGNDFTGYSLWQTNGSTEGTFQITDYYLGELSSNTPHKPFSLNETMYFFSDSLNAGLNGLWKVEDSAGEAERVFPGRNEWLQFSNQTNATLSLMVMSDLNKAFFTIQTTDDQMQLWVTDGTTAGTHALENVSGAQYFNPRMFMDGGNHLLFTALDSTSRAKLWRTDGTREGTLLVKDICLACDGYEAFSD